jgi:hypothetical protein
VKSCWYATDVVPVTATADLNFSIRFSVDDSTPLSSPTRSAPPATSGAVPELRWTATKRPQTTQNPANWSSPISAAETLPKSWLHKALGGTGTVSDGAVPFGVTDLTIMSVEFVTNCQSDSSDKLALSKPNRPKANQPTTQDERGRVAASQLFYTIRKFAN